MKNMKIKLKYYKKRLNNKINYKTIKNHIKKINLNGKLIEEL